MGQSHKSREELLRKLEEARARVKKLEKLVVESTGQEILTEYLETHLDIHKDHLPEVDSFESTETLDLTGLFASDVTSSGSYYTKGIGKTLFGRLMEALPVPALLVSGSKQVVFANRACRKITPAYAKLVGRPFCDLFPGASTAKDLGEAADQVFASRRVLCRKAALQIGDRRMWGRVTLRSVRLGTERLLFALIEDLTEEHKRQEALSREIRAREGVEQALRESRQRLELVFSGAKMFSWDWDVKTRSLICHRSFSKFLGYRENEIPPRIQWWQKLVHPDDRPGAAKSIKRYFQGSSSMLEHEYRVRARSGEWKWILTRGKIAEKDQQGRPVRMLGVNLDITQRKEAEHRVRNLTHSMIQALERERERISLDLHDQVAQDLSAVRIMLETILPSLINAKPDLASRISHASQKVREVIQAVRDISYHLRPAGIDRLGLVSTTRHYCEEFSEKHAVRAEFFTSGMGELALDFDTEINLFRVIQESLNNVAKHAKATRVLVGLVGNAGRITLSVEDDGRGFGGKGASATGLTGEKMGLWCMEQRVGLLNGKLTIRSIPKKGTRIHAVIPYRGDKHGIQNKDTDSG